MSCKQITSRQMESMIMMFLLGSAFVMGATSKTKQDTWITFIVGAAMSIPMIFVYCAIIRKYPGENLFEIIIKLFGKIIGKTVCILYVWYALHSGSMVLRTFTEFIHIMNMPETPQIVIGCFMVLLAAWAINSGVENMGRIAKFSFPILISFVAITILISFKDMNFSNIKPVLSTDFTTLLGASYTIFTLPFGEMILFLTIFPCVKSKSSPKKIYMKSLILSTVILLLAHLRNLLVLGVASVGMFVFPSYQVVSIMSVGEFFTRMEVLIGTSVLMAGFTKVCVFLFTASVGLAKVCNVKDYKRMIAPCSLIIILLSKIIFANSVEMNKWLNFHPIYTILFQIILPIIILIAAEIKTRKKKPAPLEPENMGSLE